MEELRDDVEKRGLLTPITLYEGKILDGRNRATACLSLDIKPKYEEYSGDDPLGFVMAKNMYRRHLNESQRAVIAAKLTTLEETRYTQKQAAEMLNVSQRLISDAAKVQREASEDNVQAVERGDKSIHAVVREMNQAELDADEGLPDVDAEAQLLFMVRSITREAKRLRTDMDALLEREGWSAKYKELHAKVRGIVFDE
jgi:predicted transcriptional regulator